LAERDLPDVGARLYHHARHLRTVATPRAIGGDAPHMIWSRYDERFKTAMMQMLHPIAPSPAHAGVIDLVDLK
jgi:hypothetical protein